MNNNNYQVVARKVNFHSPSKPIEVKTFYIPQYRPFDYAAFQTIDSATDDSPYGFTSEQDAWLACNEHAESIATYEQEPQTERSISQYT